MALLPDGAVCVADSANHRLQIFSKEQGAAPRVIGSKGKQPGQFDHPHGVACDGTALYVADAKNHRVQKLRLADGAHLGTVGKADCTRGDGEGQFNWPTGLCVAAGALYVCDHFNHRIVVLGTDLAWRYTIGREGSGDGEFRFPSAVAAHGGELYVVDRWNNRVQARRPRPAAPSPARHAPPRLPRQAFAPDRHGRMRFARAFGGEYMAALREDEDKDAYFFPSPPLGQFADPTGVGRAQKTTSADAPNTRGLLNRSIGGFLTLAA